MTEYEQALAEIRALKADANRPPIRHWYDIAFEESQARARERASRLEAGEKQAAASQRNQRGPSKSQRVL